MAICQTSAVCSRNDKKQTCWTFVALIWEDFQNILLYNSVSNISEYNYLEYFVWWVSLYYITYINGYKLGVCITGDWDEVW